jgi:hypothetical protein
MLKQMKKTLSILLVVCFLMSVTAASVSAHHSRWGGWGPSWGGYPYAAPYVAELPFSVPAIQEIPAPAVTYCPAQDSAAAICAGHAVGKDKKKAASKAICKRHNMIKEKKKTTTKVVSARDGGWRGECDCDDCDYACGERDCDCKDGSFIDTFMDIFIHCLPCNENSTSENCTSENCTSENCTL